eukprot:gene13992-21405_t
MSATYSVREAFAALFDDPQERGAALCIQIGGETVVDLWAGTADKDGAEAWHSDTIANLFSCTKTFTAVTALQLVAEGKLQLDAPVAKYWPEFAAAGKEAITLRHLLCHQAGLPALRETLPAEALYDWQMMVDALAAEAPWWKLGEGHGYAAITYGWLVGELLRRADGRGPGESIVARVARPLGLDFHVGLADEDGLLDGSLLEADMLEELTREHSIGPDKTLLTQTRFGLGCMLDQPHVPNATFGLGPRAFGHPGAGVSQADTKPDAKPAVAAKAPAPVAPAAAPAPAPVAKADTGSSWWPFSSKADDAKADLKADLKAATPASGAP